MRSRDFSITLGTDPEFFFKKDGKIVPAEEVIGKKGIDGSFYKIIPDGIQVEINLKSNTTTCRQSFWSGLSGAMFELDRISKEKGVTVSLDEVIHLTQNELDKMPEDCKQFGCAPSYNIYSEYPDKVSRIPVNPATYLYRSAGGHMHFGINKSTIDRLGVENIVRLLDIFVGNTLVLFDKDKMQAERRKVYGRAGEFRVPSYGIEYRTPSNFWTKDYKYCSMSYGLARIAFSVADNPEIRDVLFNLISDKEIQESINTNDFDKALIIFERVKEVMTTFYKSNTSNYDEIENNIFSPRRIYKFLKFIRNPVKTSNTLYGCAESRQYISGFESWLENQ